MGLEVSECIGEVGCGDSVWFMDGVFCERLVDRESRGNRCRSGRCRVLGNSGAAKCLTCIQVSSWD